MKSPLKASAALLLAAVCSFSPAAFAQTATTPSTSTTPGASSTTPVAKPLGSADKKFIKDAAEQILAITRLTDLTKHTGPGGEPVKALNTKISADVGKIWGDLGTVAAARKVEMPKTEVTGNDKQMLDKLRKTEAEKFDKAFLKALDKETKKAAQVFEAGDKSVQDPDVKKIISDWTPKVKGYADDVAKAEAEASKKTK